MGELTLGSSHDLSAEKSRLRGILRRRRAEISAADRQSRERRMLAFLSTWALYRSARHICYYASFGSEARSWPAILASHLAGKTTYLPRVEDTALVAVPIRWSGVTPVNLRTGYRYIREPMGRPVDIGTLDIIVVPGLAFDRRGYRIGYGGGFYDRFLSGAHTSTVSLALAFEFQLLDEIPRESHDIPVDYLVTEAGIRATGTRT